MRFFEPVPSLSSRHTLVSFGLIVSCLVFALHNDALGQPFGMLRNNSNFFIGTRGPLFLTATNSSLSPAQIHLKRGKELRRHDDMAGAVEEFREAVRLQPNWADAHAALASALITQERYEEGLEAYRLASRLKPEDVGLHLLFGLALGNHYIKTGKKDASLLETAVTELRFVIRLEPGNPIAYAGLGVALLEQRAWDEATAALRKAILLAPNLPEAHGQLGYVLEQKGELAEAITEYQRALQLDPGDEETRTRLEKVLQQSKARRS
jgi:Flp pilus assembly protein TadD